MQLTVKGKQLDVGESLRTHVAENLGGVAEKYFQNALEATVTFHHEAHRYGCDISVHVGRGIHVQASAEANEPYPAFDQAAEKIDSRLRRYKTRLRDHHKRMVQANENGMSATAYILEDKHDGPEDHVKGEPAIVAELSTQIDTLTVAEAVMRMDLADVPAFMFRNAGNGGLNMVYRRKDGAIGWVDPKS